MVQCVSEKGHTKGKAPGS